MKQAYYHSQLGTVKMNYQNETLYSLKITNESIKDNRQNNFTDKVFREIEEYLNGQRKVFDIKYELEGTDFQRKVWKVLEEIPYGQTTTYLEIAKKINSPKAVRAVGGACHKNPLWFIIPCHRVVGANGKLTGYAGGLSLKDNLLKIEQTYSSIVTKNNSSYHN